MLTNLIIGATYKVVELHPADGWKKEITKNNNEFLLNEECYFGEYFFIIADGYPHLELIDTNGCTELSDFMSEVVNFSDQSQRDIKSTATLMDGLGSLINGEQVERSCLNCNHFGVCKLRLEIDNWKHWDENSKEQGKIFQSLANCCLEYKS